MTGFSISGPLYLVMSAALYRQQMHSGAGLPLSLTRNLQPRDVVLVRKLETEPLCIVIDVLNFVK